MIKLSRRIFTFLVIAVCMDGLVAFMDAGEANVSQASSALRSGQSSRHGQGFVRVPTNPVSGIQFTNRLSEVSAAENRVLLNGSGVCTGDFDNDGLPDIFFCGLNNANALFRNSGGWRFESMSGPGFESLSLNGVYSRGAVMADVNADGWRDILITTVGSGTRLFLNQSGKGFVEATDSWGIRSAFGSSTLALADFNRDGFPDLYIANNRANDIRDQGRIKVRMVNGKPQVPRELQDRITFINGVLNEFGEPDQLLQNLRGEKFVPIPWTQGNFLDSDGNPLKSPPLDWGLSASFRDVNADGWPDLYVCNDFWTPDRFWINQGNNYFQALDALRWKNSPASSMGVDFSDLNADGLLDFFAVDMLSRDPELRKRQKPAQAMSGGAAGELFERPQFLRNTLYRNWGNATFAEIANFAGVAASDWSWNPVFLDVNLDGRDDILISAGHEMDVQDMDAMMKVWSLQKNRPESLSLDEVRQQYIADMIEHNRIYPKLPLPVVSFENLGDFQFKESTAQWGMNTLAIRHGFATADFDQDGDLDLVFNCLNSPAEIYENQASAPRISIQLRDAPGNMDAIGARLIFRSGDLPAQYREIVSGGRYVSGSDSTQVFASTSTGGELTIHWPSGETSTHRDLVPGQKYVLSRIPSTPPSIPKPENPIPVSVKSWMIPRSLNPPMRTPESSYDDFARQSLIPYSLSHRGPGLSWFDVNQDGLDDLLIGDSGMNAPMVATQDGTGDFQTIALDRTQVSGGEIPQLLGWHQSAQSSSLLAFQDGYELNQPGKTFQLPTQDFKTKPLEILKSRPADQIHGGWVSTITWLPAHNTYALLASSGPGDRMFPMVSDVSLFLLQGEEWVRDGNTSNFLKSLGLISSALWTDLNQDGHPDLALAAHWGGIHILMQTNGQFLDRSADLGIPPDSNGLWNGLVSGDFNGDGYPDILASNWGTNAPWSASDVHPMNLFFGEVARPGVTDIVLTEWNLDHSRMLTFLPLEPLAKAMPFIVKNFRSYKEFSELPVDRVIGQRFSLMQNIPIHTLQSSLWINHQGKKFIRKNLPQEIDYSPAFGMAVADFDGNGTEDIFVAQNFSATHSDMPVFDAGLGLLLSGVGDGSFQSLSPTVSGIRIHGDMRAAAISDFNNDQRPDLAVSLNGKHVLLFENQLANPGLTVIIQGPPANPEGLGSSLQLVADNRSGPVKELQTTTSYLSGNSRKLLFSIPDHAQSLHLNIRWPGSSRMESHPIPPQSSQIIVRHPGRNN
ncbi:MAG: VCBS repeat-containing protein [Verrucomicrobia bacterium]|nr:VCBS repeat-containing protein [Verrucomicrobiota bacterium]